MTRELDDKEGPHIWVSFPQTGKMSKLWHLFYFLKLYCDQTFLIFQLFSTTGCPRKNTLMYVEEILSVGLKKYFVFDPSIFLFCNFYRFHPQSATSGNFGGRNRAFQ